MKEQGFIDEFDKQDETAIHILIYVDGNPIGTSITKRVLNPDYPMAENFVKNWLIPLFSADLIK